MRLVKAALVAACVLAAAACKEAPAQGRAAEVDCRFFSRRPGEPRVVSVAADGTLQPGPRCATANCLAGARGVFAFHEGEMLHAVVGDRAVDVPVVPRSSLYATPSMGGISVADGLLAVDRGDEVELVFSDGRTARAPALRLRPGETADLHVAGDGVVVEVGPHHLVSLLPPAPPAPDARALFTVEGAVTAWLSPPGARPTMRIGLDGSRRPLGVDVPARGHAVDLGAGIFVVECTRHSLLVPGRPPLEMSPQVYLRRFGDRIIGLDLAPPGALVEVVDGSLQRVMTAEPGTDFAGAPLPPGARVKRVRFAAHDDRILVVERIERAACGAQDRLLLLDPLRRTARVLADDDKMRMHPHWAGDRFRFVEAN